jgi:hypothetical protein
MTRRTSAQAFGDAASAMIRHGDVGDTLEHLVRDCVEVLGAGAAAILVTDDRGRLSLLTSSSSSASQLEMLQAQDGKGPCVDVIDAGVPILVSGAHEIESRWGQVGRAILDAGFTTVEAFPLVWRGQVLGGLNVFGDAASGVARDDPALAQTFADVATVVLVHSSALSTEQLTTRVHEALAARTRIEQAKGVLRETEDLDLEGAADRLQDVARTHGLTVSHAAMRILRQAYERS